VQGIRNHGNTAVTESLWNNIAVTQPMNVKLLYLFGFSFYCPVVSFSTTERHGFMVFFNLFLHRKKKFAKIVFVSVLYFSLFSDCNTYSY